MRLVAGRRQDTQLSRIITGAILFHCNDDFALCASGLDVGQRIPGPLKREHLVDDWPDDTGFDQGRNLTQLLPLRAHEQE